MSTAVLTTERILCHCLRVSEEQVQDAVWINACRSIKDVIDCTGAGSGCTACHCRIAELLEDSGCEVKPRSGGAGKSLRRERGREPFFVAVESDD